ncbi:MAG: hypothetical protein KBA95_01935 [Acidobacteria bacterium]|nr:hypothetical protein [Acidobacteriota bacterium]
MSDEARREWLRLTEEYALDDPAAQLILTTAFEAFDRMRGAQRELTLAGGVTFRDRFGKPKVHPAVAVERDARAGWLAALKQLNLDLEPLRDAPGRPPGSPADGPPRRPMGGLFPED